MQVLLLIWDTPVGWDLGGHIQAARDFSEHIFPYFSGWNPHQLLGYPQGYFYPSLLPWLVSALDFLGVPLQFGFFLILSLSLIALPWSWWKLIRAVELPNPACAIALLWWIYFLPKGHLGGDFWGFFRVGLVNQSFALPFVFFYWAESASSKPRVHRLSLWLSLLVLSHAFMAVAALLGGLLWWRLKLKTYLTHGFVVLGLCSVWVIPYLVLRSHSAGISVPTSSLWFEQWLVHSGILLGGLQLTLTAFMVVSFRKLASNPFARRTVLWALSWFLILATLIGLDHVLRAGLPVPLHLYRFVAPGLYILGLAWAWSLSNPRSNTRWSLGSLGLLLALTSVYTIGQLPDLSGKTDLRKPFDLEDRVLVSASKKSWPGTLVPHFLMDALTEQNHSVANGLFVESSRNSGFVFSALLGLVNNPFMWGAQSRNINPEALAGQLNWLGVTHVLSNEPILLDPLLKDPKNQAATLSTQYSSQEVKLWILRLNNARVEAPKRVQFQPLSKPQELSDWWADPYRIEQALVHQDTRGELDQAPALGRVKDQDSERIALELPDDQQRLWVLKEGYFPHWKLSSGEAVFAAAPYVMAFRAQGKVELHFHRPAWELACYVVSILSWVLWSLWPWMLRIRLRRSKLFVFLFLLLPTFALAESKFGVGWLHQCRTQQTRVECWGDNSFGQVGNNSTRPTQAAERVFESSSDILELQLGPQSTCARTSSGWHCWGRFPTVLQDKAQYTPRLVSELGTKSLRMGLQRWCTWENRSVTCFGDRMETHSTPSPIEDLAVSNRELCYRSTNRAYCWSEGRWVVKVEPAAWVIVGEHHQCAGTETQLRCWGRNTFGQLGTGDRLDRTEPSIVALPLGKIEQVRVGGSHTCAIVDAQLWCWGQNLRGQARPFASELEIESLTRPEFTGIKEAIRNVYLGLVGSCAASDTLMRCWAGLIDPVAKQWWQF